MPFEHCALPGRGRIEGPVRLVQPRTDLVEREACGLAHAPLPRAVGGRAARAHRRADHAIERARKRVERRENSELGIAAGIGERDERTEPIFEVAQSDFVEVWRKIAALDAVKVRRRVELARDRVEDAQEGAVADRVGPELDPAALGVPKLGYVVFLKILVDEKQNSKTDKTWRHCTKVLGRSQKTVNPSYQTASPRIGPQRSGI